MIQIKELKQGFENADLRVKFREVPPSTRTGFRSRATTTPVFTVDVEQDKQGEYFEVAYSPDVEPWDIIDRDNAHRHVLLMDRATRAKLLVGHDETHLFVSRVASETRNIDDAIVRLAPPELRNAMKGQKKSLRNIWKRSTSRYVRQGEWFFIPEPNAKVDETLILHDEPLQRNAGSKAHFCEDMYRSGGDTVYLVRGRKIITTIEMTAEQWAMADKSEYSLIRTAVRDAIVFVRGAIRHPDHKTIHLNGWHRVLINSELILGNRSGFLD